MVYKGVHWFGLEVTCADVNSMPLGYIQRHNYKLWCSPSFCYWSPPLSYIIDDLSKVCKYIEPILFDDNTNMFLLI